MGGGVSGGVGECEGLEDCSVGDSVDGITMDRIVGFGWGVGCVGGCGGGWAGACMKGWLPECLRGKVPLCECDAGAAVPL